MSRYSAARKSETEMDLAQRDFLRRAFDTIVLCHSSDCDAYATPGLTDGEKQLHLVWRINLEGIDL